MTSRTRIVYVISVSGSGVLADVEHYLGRVIDPLIDSKPLEAVH